MNQATQRPSRRQRQRANKRQHRPQVTKCPTTYATKRERYVAPVMSAEERAAYDAYFNDQASMNSWRDDI